ncbi:amino acid ABC transporter permease [Mycolicibacterium mageritense]|uniref:L-cystine transport system permease protein YecS n=1 Tax=Mycolicibacterium mageritense TaxID=53462 RepID=A0AAI8XLE2_MYCME|nr:amino acid ABC transporter permease [Mycolicibacterium mageritense]BDY26697.1 L-cystine transport system permease protein YecS [Mycolicibacterium mageritense]
MTTIFDYVFSASFFEAAWVTLYLTIVSMALGIVGGLLLALMKAGRVAPVRWVADFYIWLFRGTPVLLQLIFVFNVLPTMGLTLSAITCAILALSLNEAAYMAEIIRGGLLGVDKGQRVASHMLGLTPVQSLRYVILPQTARLILPPTGNQLIGMLKTSALASVVAVSDLLLTAQRQAAGNFDYIGSLTAAAIYYLILTTAFTFLLRQCERRLDIDVRSSKRRRKTERAKTLEGVA